MLQNYHTTAAGTHSDMFPKPDPPTRATQKGGGGGRKEKEKYTLHVFFFFLSNP